MSNDLPGKADVVVIGGGIAGLSALYHLAREGITNTVLLERRQLACGTTWHSIGSVGQVRGSRLLTLLSSCTAQMLPELEQETGLQTGYKRYGSIGLALNEGRLEEFKRTVAIARAWGHEAAMLSAKEVKERYPEVEVGDVLGALFLPGDGRTNPVDTVQALAKACRRRGAKIFEETKVQSLVVEDGRIRGVRTGRGDIEAEKILLAAGMWSREIAETVGVAVPLLAAEHFYAVTEPIAGLPRDTPMLRVPDERTYYKEDAGKLLFGCLEEVAKPWGMSGIPESFCFDSLPEDLEHFGPILETAMQRMPLLKEAGIKLFFNGPESFTPDGNFHLGETAEVTGLYVSCGFNTIGVMASGGIGMMAAQLMARGNTDWDMSGFDVKRAARFETNIRYLAARNVEGLGKLYGLQCPDQPYNSARGIRLSPLHARHLEHNAFMDHVAGWERPAVFAPRNVVARVEPTFSRQAWHEWCAGECRMARDGAVIVDQSAIAKVLLAGPDAMRAATGLFARLPAADEPATRTLLLGAGGRIGAIVQLVCLAHDRLLVLGPAGDEVRLHALITQRIAGQSSVVAVDVTSGFCALDLFGPQVGERLASAGLRRRQTRAGEANMVDLGLADARMVDGGEHGLACTRLILETDKAWHLYATLIDSGFVPAGAWAMRAMRLEQGIPGWGTEVDPTMTAAEAGLEILAAMAPANISVFAQLRLVEAGPLLHGREPIYHDGKFVGWMVGSSFGSVDGRSIGIAYIADALRGMKFPLTVDVEIADKRHRGVLGNLPPAN